MKALIKPCVLIVGLIGLAVFALAGSAAPLPRDLSTFQSPELFLGIGGMIINQANLNDLFRGFKAAFNTGFRSTEPQWSRVATPVPSTTSEEKYAWLGQFPRLRKWLGSRVIKSIAAHDYSIINEKFESTIGVGRDPIEDDKFGVFSPLFQEMGFAAVTHPDELVFSLLNAGFATNCYDGQFFFDTDHPVGNEETGIASVSNMQAGANPAWFLMDDRRPLKPIIKQDRRAYDFRSMTRLDDEHVFMKDEYVYGVDARLNVGFGFWQLAHGSKATLDPGNYQAARQAMMSFKSDEGRPLGVMPNLLVVGPSNEAPARTVIDKQLVDQGESNIHYKSVDLLVVPWLD